MKLEHIGVIPSKQKQFATKGIHDVNSLLLFTPRRYNDFTELTGMDLDINPCSFEVICDRVELRNASIPIIVAHCREPLTNTTVTVNWFNCAWDFQRLKQYSQQGVVVIGKLEYHPIFGYSVKQPVFFDYKTKLGIFPVYPAIAGMSKDYLYDKMKKALAVGVHDAECLPNDIIRKEHELPMATALKYIHTPTTLPETFAGAERLMLNDLTYFALNNELNKTHINAKSQFQITDTSLCNQILQDLPFDLTTDQTQTLNDLIEIGSSGRRINALLQGDVGSGKTIVSALLCAAFISSGYQTVLMAPTKVLAKQHYKTMSELFSPYGIRVAFIDGTPTKERTAEMEAIAAGKVNLVVGTHACISSKVTYANLGLTVVDEEHKFGVAQREALNHKADHGVHSIIMSATPIPRSLAKVKYGESMELCAIKTMPNGRKPIQTNLITDENQILSIIHREISAGHQAYIVCPLIEDSEKLDSVCSVDTVFKQYQTYFKPFGVTVEAITSKTNAEQAAAIISRFEQNQSQILIATTVIEVGVNIPNATAIVIMDADRFGLSQLHQLRGRVGRSELQSYCILYSTKTENKSLARLKTLTQVTDGFVIAEKDLEFRGAGDLYGIAQSGDNKYITQMLMNPECYQKAVQIAQEIIRRGLDCCKLGQQVQTERELDQTIEL